MFICRGDVIQYRFSNKKGDSNRGRDPSRGACEHFQGEERPILAISDFVFVLLIISQAQSHKDKLIKFVLEILMYFDDNIISYFIATINGCVR